MKISKKLIDRIRLSEKRQYQIAHEAGIHPSTLSRLICGIEKAKPKDVRVISIGDVLNVPVAECFQDDNQ